MDRLKLIPLIVLSALLVFIINADAGAQEEAPADTAEIVKPAPPQNVRVVDNPNDNGHYLLIRWDPSPDEGKGDNDVMGYNIYRSDKPDGEYRQMGTMPVGFYEYEDGSEEEVLAGEKNLEYMEIGETYYYKLTSVTPQDVESEFTEPVSGVPTADWFHAGKLSYFIALFLYISLVLYFIKAAKSGQKLYIRPLGGIEAIDNAIGRATEMGRPILFVLGTGTASDIATIAGYTILGRVARKTAEYQIPVLVPVNEPVMMSVAQETVRNAYIEAGRPDLYDEKNIPYVTAMQFPYVAAVNGIMIREKTATNFYMGLFHAEALLLAETGATTGAIQISGTDQPSQLPFFIAATDFTLIGEELYAASAYLSGQPLLLGPLKAQDYAKALLIVIMVIGLITMTIGWSFWYDLFSTNIT
ncbi:MAG: hypothetical protein GF307_14580 [candidate division Zixibacteria bacterium]|nr:hypothetical protein [candidate division Zixibacteria bacterium]